jgi:hypothetical protein
MRPVKRLALFLFFLLAGASRSNAQAIVQTTLCNQAFASTATCTPSSNVTAGNAYIVYWYTRNGTTSDTQTISDNNSDTFVRIQTIGGTNMVSTESVTISLFYACNISATPNAKPTYTTVNSSGSSVIYSALILEISNIKASCYDQSAQNRGSTGSHTVSWSGPTITPDWNKTFFLTSVATDSGGDPEAQSPFAFANNVATSDEIATYLYTGNSAVTPTYLNALTDTNTQTLQMMIALVPSSASPVAGAAAHHKLLSLLPAIPFFWERGWIPVAMFRRRRELLEIREAEG